MDKKTLFSSGLCQGDRRTQTDFVADLLNSTPLQQLCHSLFAENACPSFTLLAGSILGSIEANKVIRLTHVAEKVELEFCFFPVIITKFCVFCVPG